MPTCGGCSLFAPHPGLVMLCLSAPALPLQEAAQGRALPPLEPGVKLRLRHPSKPTTVEVELASGQRLAAFPPAPVHTSRSSSGAGCSWDPLPTPPGARYTFEARLRQFAARQPVQLAAALDGSEETADAASSRQRKGGYGACASALYCLVCS